MSDHFTVEIEGMEKVENMLNSMLKRSWKGANMLANGLAHECRNEAIKLVRKRSRFLAHNIHVKDNSAAPGKIEVYTHTNKVPYAAVIEFGFPEPLVIRPKNKKALFWKGAEHPVKKVTIPPRPPYPYLRPAAEKAIEKLPKLYDAVTEELLK